VLIIFGLRRRGYRMANVFAMCGICHTPAAQAVVRIKTFFTLFFIPLVSVGTKYRSTCTMCGGTIELSKDQADQAMVTMQQQRAQAQAQQTPAFAQAPASQAPVVDASAPPQVPAPNANGGEPPTANSGS
jgi:hypothetical protein